MMSEKKEIAKRTKAAKTEADEQSKLREQAVELQKEKDELFAKLQRVSADYANYQKRAPKQIADSIAYEKEQVIRSLLPVLDNFEHTLQNAESGENADAVIKGIQIVYDQMLGILKSHEVEQIKSLNEKFDPSLHQAMMQRCEPDKEDGLVVEEFQKGYKLKDRVIRPSKVIVNKIAQEQESENEAGDEVNEVIEE